jgi:glycosyltransferase involved in cell wall biosynthesis
MTPALVFDVSSLTRLRTANQRPSGIQRVQLEIATQLARGEDGDAELGAFDRDTGVFHRVDRAELSDILSRIRGRLPSAAVPEGKSPEQHRWTDDVLARIAARTPATAAHARRSAYYLRRSLAEVGHACAEATHALRSARRDLRSRRRVACFSDSWSHDTVYCSVGADWIDGDLDYLRRRKAEVGFTAVLTIHDLIPVVRPQFLQGADDLSHHFSQVLRIADRILVISESTAGDVRTFAAAQDLELPELIHIPLGSDLVDGPRAAPVVLADDSDLTRQGFVLTVGTVEIRKNHHLLLDVWETLVTEFGRGRTPRLIVAGQRGWLSSETVARLAKTPSLAGAVQFVEGPSDAELAWLYAHATFTLFPAYYEGWGLPVSESLDFGKLCITGNGSSLPEAGEGLTDLLDPTDRAAWRERILQYWSDRDLLADREQEIRQHHRHVTSADTTRAVLEAARSATRRTG